MVLDDFERPVEARELEDPPTRCRRVDEDDLDVSVGDFAFRRHQLR
jgi:hypothetical protein